MKHIRDRLKKKGWHKKHIDEAISIFSEAQKRKHPGIFLLDQSVFWVSLSIAILGNFIIAVSLIPLLLTLSGTYLYLIIAIMGFSFGLLFELLIRTITHLESHHHLLLGAIIPAISFITFLAIVFFVNAQQTTEHNAFWIGIIYVIAFILPYFAYRRWVGEE